MYRVRGGDTEEREIVLGKRNDDYVIVEEGLAPGDRVALRDPTLVARAPRRHARRSGEPRRGPGYGIAGLGRRWSYGKP